MEALSRQFPGVDHEDLASIRDFVESSAIELGANEEQAGELVMAVHEAATNIVDHGYLNGQGWISVSISKEPGQLVVQVLDRSPPFDPSSFPTPDISLPLEERPCGGLGIHMIRSFTDEVHYKQSSSGENELTLIKQLTDDSHS